MAPGPRTKRLTAQQIQWLRNFKISHGYSTPDLNASLCSPFKWRTLQKALDGKAINEASHGYIVQWLERYAPPFAIRKPALSGKDRAAGQTEDGDHRAPMGDAGARRP